MNHADAKKAPDAHLQQLATKLCTAYVSHQMCVTYKTAEKYVDKGEPGELWLFLADMATRLVNAHIDETYGKYFEPADPILSAEILDDSQ